jgi:ketosteroid isomerase-like protein
MSAQANVQLVKNLFAAMDSGDLEAVQALTADDIEWVVPGEGTGRQPRARGTGRFLQMRPIRWKPPSRNRLNSSRRATGSGRWLQHGENQGYEPDVRGRLCFRSHGKRW